jgi:hypothetical protein
VNPSGSRPRSPPRLTPEALSDHPFGPGKARITRGAFATVVIAHFLIIVLSPLPFRFGPFGPQPQDPADAELIEIVWLSLEALPTVPAEAVPAADDAVFVPAPPPATAPSGPAPSTPPAAGDVADADPAPDGPAPSDARPDDPNDPDDDDDDVLTIAERLQPRSVDPRLWAPIDEEYLELTEEERARLLIEGLIQTYNDSLQIAQALSERATDWTFTDDQGRRWGLSPGRLHLGDFSVPLPAIATPRGRIESVLARQFVTDDLARAAVTAQIRDTWGERARAIRERLELERQQRGVPLAPTQRTRREPEVSTSGAPTSGDPAAPGGAPTEPRGPAPGPRVPAARDSDVGGASP